MYIKKCSTSARLSDSSTHGNKKRVTHPAQTRLFLCNSIFMTSKYFTFIHCLSKSDRFWGVKRACFGKRTRQSIAEHKVQQDQINEAGKTPKPTKQNWMHNLRKKKGIPYVDSAKAVVKRHVASNFVRCRARRVQPNNVNKRTLQFVSHSQGISNITPPAELPTDQRRTRESSKTLQACKTRILVWRSYYTLARHNKPTSNCSSVRIGLADWHRSLNGAVLCLDLLFYSFGLDVIAA